MMDGAELASWRRTQRAALIAARNGLSAADHDRYSHAIGEHLAAHFGHLAGRLVGLYWPVRNEFDPRPFVERLLAGGASAALPAVTGRGQPLEFRLWHPGAAMAPGEHDIPCPAGGEPVKPDALLIPLLGFDDAGYRLGYGAGYYDWTLASYDVRPLTIGLGFELGRLPTIYPQPHDVPMNFIVTEAGVSTNEGN
jgi:5-formyltetrahydrofolate cyclo-ligase